MANGSGTPTRVEALPPYCGRIYNRLHISRKKLPDTTKGFSRRIVAGFILNSKKLLY